LTPPTQPRLAFLVTCEHGGNRTPAPFDDLFRGHERLLASHRGYDAGALEMGRDLARLLGAPYVAATVSRLVVELNRPPDDPAFFSSIMRRAPERYRALAVRRYALRHRQRVDAIVEAAAAAGRRVVHIGAHSFTPVRNGVARAADVGLLYDPRRPFERAFCARWQAAFRRIAPQWTVRLNYPYRSSDPGLTTELRRAYSSDEYAGIELELNQKWPRAGGRRWVPARAMVLASRAAALEVRGRRETKTASTRGRMTTPLDSNATGFPPARE
jgi:predicted N-formylglutamate amidohydrolase